MKHKRTIKELTTKAQNIRKEISDLILNLPDNRLAKKIGTRAFTINLSDLLPDTCLSAETYDFRHQYEKIVQYIDQVPIEKVYNHLTSILKPKHENKSYWLPMPNKNRLRLHPTVVKNIKKILEID